jgi:sugar O-acyltransferase (sialic acid O-acetyltransferase NeuD family)
MKKLLIIGARGMGREVYNLAMQSNGFQTEFQIKGFLDDKADALNGFNSYPPIIDSVENYIVEEDDVFICALGDVLQKKKYIQLILDKGGSFLSLIHPSATVNLGAEIGNGCIILQNAFIGDHAKIGDFVLIQVSTVIGHDVQIGSFSRIDCLALCVGGTEIKEEVTIHTGAVINHGVVVEKNAQVGALSFVIRRVKENTTVYGNPATKLK